VDLLTPGTFPQRARRLAAADPVLAGILDRHGLPAFWHRPPGFPTLVLFILEQQVSLASARAAFHRLHQALGGAIAPGQVLAASDPTLRTAGVSRQKARYLRALAEAVLDGSLDLERVAAAPDEDARTLLESLPGIGRWTSDVYLLSSLRRPDVWPVGDRALQVATGEALSLAAPPGPGELEGIGERWRPFRAVAARLLWHSYLARRGRTEPEYVL
jgi:DNA-3-methyladenine glycosylase II